MSQQHISVSLSLDNTLSCSQQHSCNYTHISHSLLMHDELVLNVEEVVLLQLSNDITVVQEVLLVQEENDPGQGEDHLLLNEGYLL